MTNPYRSLLLTLLKIADVTVVAVALYFAILLTTGASHVLEVLLMRVQVLNLVFTTLYLLFCHTVLRSFGLYRSHRLAKSSREWDGLARAVLVMAATLVVAGLMLDFSFLTPPFVLWFAALSLVGLGAERRLMRLLARFTRRSGRNLRNVIVIGEGHDALDLAGRMARRGDLGYSVVAVLSPSAAGAPPVAAEVARLLDERAIDEVFLAVPLDAERALIQDVVQLCEEQGVTVRVLSSLVDLILARAQVDEIDGRPVITIFSGPPDSLLLAAKRAMDVLVSATALVLAAPLLALLALVVKLDSRGPVLFVQDRVGLNGRRFGMLKVRTMIEGAQTMQPALEANNEANGPVFKIRDDPRITRVGRWLRRLSLDELPQLWNVLRGDMSLVGPRPLPLRDVERIDLRAHRRRLSVRPGLTCLWQVQSRLPEFDEWIKTDLEYIDNWSLGLDLRILLRTIPAVLSGRGAY